MNGNLEFKLESKGIMVSLPLCVESFDILRKVIDVVERDNGFHEAVVSDEPMVVDTGLKDRVVGFILGRKVDTFTKASLLKFLDGVKEADVDHVLSCLIADKLLYQWVSQDKYPCFRVKKQYVELYGGA